MSDADAVGDTAGDPVAALSAAADDLAAARERVDDPGTAADVADLRDELLALFESYEERATDWDDFEGYAEFRTEMAERVEALDDDLPADAREAVEAADDALVTGGVAETLSAADFERAREALAPLSAYADRHEALRDARDRYRRARRRVADRHESAAERVADLERVAAFADADLDADLAPLREPIAAYNDAVAADVEALRAETPAREALATLAAAARRPLVEADPPPDELRAFLREDPAGEEPLATLAEWAGYSPSKLAHYAADADAFRRRVTTHRSYIEDIDAAPFRVSWPPPPADELRWRCRELESAVRGFADEPTVAALRTVRRLPRHTDYADLRRAARAAAALDADARRRLREGTVEADLADARAERDRLADALDEYPPVTEF
ncbi:MAG: hypothetical protein ABEH77_11155 [Halobacteriaceae archaeon]